MAETYITCGKYPGIVKEQASWVGAASEHPRKLYVPLVLTRGEHVFLLRDIDGRTPRMPALTFVSDNYPKHARENGRNLFPDNRYLRLQFAVDSYLRATLLTRPEHSDPEMNKIMFMNRWKAYSEDIPPDTKRYAGVAALSVASTMVEVKHLPFHAEITADPLASDKFVRRQQLDAERPIMSLPIRRTIETLGDVVEVTRDEQAARNFTDIIQLLEIIQNMKAGEYAAHPQAV